MFITSPPADSPWVWGDPGHTRFMGPEVYTFLDRREYIKQLGKTPMSDYRRYFTSNWEIVAVRKSDGTVVLRNIK